MQEKEQFIVTIKTKLSNMVDADTASAIIDMINIWTNANGQTEVKFWTH